MTKLLYLPTNEYLKFWIEDGDNGTGFNTTKIESAGSYLTPRYRSVEEAVEAVVKASPGSILFLEVNNIQHLPILREELEVIYDE
jgi:hypothetical protein